MSPERNFTMPRAETQVLGLVLRQAIGKSLADYLSEKIWQPMGAESDASWIVDKSGQEAAFCCLGATLRDFARLGMLLANDGVANGKQIVPKEWVREATQPTPGYPHLKPGVAPPLFWVRLPILGVSRKQAPVCLAGNAWTGNFR